MTLVKFRQLVVLLLLVAAVSGCTHRNLMKDGENFSAQGRHELAMQAYQKALDLKPDDAETRHRFEQAKSRFDQWLEHAQQAADTAYAGNRLGKAMLLYGKVADATRRPAALNKYNEIHQQLASNHRLYVQLESDPYIFGDDLGLGLPGLTLVPGVTHKSDNEAAVKITRGSVRFNYRETESPEVEQYVSGQVAVVNPDYLQLQQDVSNQRYRLEQDQDKLATYRHDHKDLDRDLNRLEKDLREVDRKLAGLDPQSPEYQALKNEKQKLLTDISNMRNRVRRAKDKVEQQRGQLDRSQYELDELIAAFDHVPPKVWEDVISDYHYTRNILTKTASSVLIVEIDGRRREVPIEVFSEDDHYQGHPTIGLPAKSADLEPDQGMTRRLNAQARVTAENQLKSLVYNYKQDLLSQAGQATSNDERFDRWVNYGVAGVPGVEDALVHKMRAHLELELGRAGEFDINRLLNLYPTHYY